MNAHLVSELRKFLNSLDESLSESEEFSIEEIADVLLELNLAKRDLGYIYQSVESALAAKMTDKILDLRDGAQIERKVATSRSKWRHKDLASDVAARIRQSAVDMDTGEVVMTPEDMVVKLLDFVQPSYWRVGELGKIGLNPDNYCEVGDTDISIILRKGNAQ